MAMNITDFLNKYSSLTSVKIDDVIPHVKLSLTLNQYIMLHDETKKLFCGSENFDQKLANIFLKLLNKFNYLILIGNTNYPVSLEYYRGQELELININMSQLKSFSKLFSGLKTLICNKCKISSLKELFCKERRDLDEYNSLEYLQINSCQLRSIDNSLCYMKNLTSLNLSRNKLKEFQISQFVLANLEFLDLSFNYLTSLDFISANLEPNSESNPLENLKCFYVQNNRITSLKGIEKMINLQIFDASHNLISIPKTTKFLKRLKRLTDLNLNNNPIIFQKNYREAVINDLHSSAVFQFNLDGKDLTNKEKMMKLNENLDIYDASIDPLARIESLNPQITDIIGSSLEEKSLQETTPASLSAARIQAFLTSDTYSDFLTCSTDTNNANTDNSENNDQPIAYNLQIKKPKLKKQIGTNSESSSSALKMDDPVIIKLKDETLMNFDSSIEVKNRDAKRAIANVDDFKSESKNTIADLKKPLNSVSNDVKIIKQIDEICIKNEENNRLILNATPSSLPVNTPSNDFSNFNINVSDDTNIKSVKPKNEVVAVADVHNNSTNIKDQIQLKNKVNSLNINDIVFNNDDGIKVAGLNNNPDGTLNIDKAIKEGLVQKAGSDTSAILDPMLDVKDSSISTHPSDNYDVDGLDKGILSSDHKPINISIYESPYKFNISEYVEIRGAYENRCYSVNKGEILSKYKDLEKCLEFESSGKSNMGANLKGSNEKIDSVKEILKDIEQRDCFEVKIIVIGAIENKRCTVGNYWLYIVDEHGNVDDKFDLRSLKRATLEDIQENKIFENGNELAFVDLEEREVVIKLIFDTLKQSRQKRNLIMKNIHEAQDLLEVVNSFIKIIAKPKMECLKCDHIFENLRWKNDRQINETECPKCGGKTLVETNKPLSQIKNSSWSNFFKLGESDPKSVPAQKSRHSLYGGNNGIFGTSLSGKNVSNVLSNSLTESPSRYLKRNSKAEDSFYIGTPLKD